MLEQRQLRAQLRHDRRGEVAAGFTAFGLGRDVAEGQGEVAAQTGGGAAGAGQPERPDRPRTRLTSRQIFARSSGLIWPVAAR